MQGMAFAWRQNSMLKIYAKTGNFVQLHCTWLKSAKRHQIYGPPMFNRCMLQSKHHLMATGSYMHYTCMYYTVFIYWTHVKYWLGKEIWIESTVFLEIKMINHHVLISFVISSMCAAFFFSAYYF